MFHPRWNTTHIHLFASLLFSLSLSPSSPVHGKGIECQSRETTPRVLASKPPKYSSLRRHQTHSRSPSLFHPSLLACFFKFYLTTRSSVSVSTKYTIELLRSRKGRDYRKEAEIRNYFPVGASCSVICSVSDFKKTTNSLKTNRLYSGDAAANKTFWYFRNLWLHHVRSSFDWIHWNCRG
jgi:hypothetical protein